MVHSTFRSNSVSYLKLYCWSPYDRINYPWQSHFILILIFRGEVDIAVDPVVRFSQTTVRLQQFGPNYFLCFSRPLLGAPTYHDWSNSISTIFDRRFLGNFCTKRTFHNSAGMYSRPGQTFRMERFLKIVNGWKPWTVSAKWYNPAWQGSENAHTLKPNMNMCFSAFSDIYKILFVLFFPYYYYYYYYYYDYCYYYYYLGVGGCGVSFDESPIIFIACKLSWSLSFRW